MNTISNAKIILTQLAGSQENLVIRTRARSFIASVDNAGIAFTIDENPNSRRKINYVKINIDDSDCYTMVFGFKTRDYNDDNEVISFNVEEVILYTGLFADQLNAKFTDATGFNL